MKKMTFYYGLTMIVNLASVLIVILAKEAKHLSPTIGYGFIGLPTFLIGCLLTLLILLSKEHSVFLKLVLIVPLLCVLVIVYLLLS